MSLTVEEAIRTRRATRKYTDDPIPQEVLDQVSELALEAPSAFNAQLRELVVVTKPEVKQALFDASGQQQMLNAPVVFITVALADRSRSDLTELLGEKRAEDVAGVLAKRDLAKARENGIKDAMLVAGFLLLAAQSAGLSTSPTTGWDEEKVKEAIGLGGREDRAIGLVIAAGYPAEFPKHPGRADDRLVDNSYSI